MSIVRTALRMATRNAIIGKTMLDDRVEDSSIDTLEDALRKEPATIAMIYTEDTRAEPQGKEIWVNGTVDLIILLSVAGVFEVKLKDSEETVTEYRYPVTDASSEFTLDMIERQIKQHLLDPQDAWAEIWKGLVTKVEYWHSLRGASSKEGARFAARQITARLQVIDDPVPGAPPQGVWKKLLDLLDADTSGKLGPVPKILRNLIQGQPIPADIRDAMQVGATRWQGRAIGLGRVDIKQDGPGERLEDYVVEELDPGRPE